TSPSPPASARSRCTAESASPGSTSCTSTTSARCGSRPSAATRASCGPASPRTCSTDGRPDDGLPVDAPAGAAARGDVLRLTGGRLAPAGSQLPHVHVPRPRSALVAARPYQRLLDSADPDDWRDPALDEREAAAMCFTSGTTGRPRGVVYSHRSTILHAFGVASMAPLGQAITQADTLLPVVPMFHA